MKSGRVFVIAVSCLLVVAASRAAAETTAAPRCTPEQLAISRAQSSAPQQHQVAGLVARNTGAPCRLALDVSLILEHADGRPLKVAGGTSWLTLTAQRLGRRGRAFAIWTYTNYCLPDSRLAGPKVMDAFRFEGHVHRFIGGGAPCNRPGHPVQLSLLFACPSADGSAVVAVTPRRLPLCLR